MNRHPFQLGIIEGFYGQPWSWQARQEAAGFMRDSGYAFYYYAPKADPFIRRKWREPFPEELFRNLEALIDRFHRAGLEFGIGFSPYEIYLSFDDEARKQLLARIETFNRLGLDRLAILFDDMKGGLPGLARMQVDIAHLIRDHARARHFAICPTYYSYDPVLDQIFGKRPATYLEELGQKLDPEIDIFWTGEVTCSKSYPPEHIREVSALIARKPLLWDNYPVNDGPKMCKFLHLRAFEGRPRELSGLLSGHAVNPMNQPVLSRIPMLTLAEVYRSTNSYSPAATFLRAAEEVGTHDFAVRLAADLDLFATRGFELLSPAEKQELVRTYSEFLNSKAGPAASEIIDWLNGRSIVGREVFLTQ